MSLEVLLVPMAIAIVVRAIDRNVRASQGSHSIAMSAKDATVLEHAILALGQSPSVLSSGVSANISGFDLVFQQDENLQFHAIASESVDASQLAQVVQMIEEQYAVEVQTSVYEKLRSRAADEGLVFESESVEEDNTIVLTYLTEGA